MYKWAAPLRPVDSKDFCYFVAPRPVLRQLRYLRLQFDQNLNYMRKANKTNVNFTPRNFVAGFDCELASLTAGEVEEHGVENCI